MPVVVALVVVAVTTGVTRAVAEAGQRTQKTVRDVSSPTTLPPPANSAAPAHIVTSGRDLPDPFVLTTRHGYYLYSSQSGFTSAPVSVATSKVLDHWGPSQAALAMDPPWATFGYTWSPDVRQIRGRYVMYFDAMATTSLFDDAALPGFQGRAQCIGTATSSSPLGPFTPQAQPLTCQFDEHGAIDPRTFVSPRGELWLDWKSDDNAVLASTAPTKIYAQRLSADGLDLVGTATVLLQADEPWQDDDHIIEAPDMVAADGTYWLFYSGGWFNQPSYGIGVARCAGPAGPCTDMSTLPWLGSNAQGSGPGEESLFVDHDGTTWMVFSPWFYGYAGVTLRPVALAQVAFGPFGPYLARWQ